MDGKAILKRIIEEEGSCCWSRPAICRHCPISKLKMKSSGGFLNCVDALGVDHLTEQQADARYKDVAERILLDEAIETLLGEEADAAE